MSQLIFPGIKINFGLYVTGLRPDGYRSLESIFLPAPWNDVIEIEEAAVNSFSLHNYGIAIDAAMEQNIVYKAWRLLHDAHGIPPLKVHLLKNVPSGAGLGAGSADGAFFLKALNDRFQLNLDREALRSLAAQLGSDCPFFIDNVPAYVTGRGEVQTALPALNASWYVLIVHPGIHVSTAKAFQMISLKAAPVHLPEVWQAPRNTWSANVSNDFEVPVFDMHPEIGDLKNEIVTRGAWYASMSGSGSAVYGFFDEEPDVSWIADNMPRRVVKLQV